MVLVSVEEDHAAAIFAALTGANAAPYDLDELRDPATRPAAYNEVTVSQRAGAPNRNVASTGRTGWRITTRSVAKTVTNAREMRSRARTGLLYVRLTVDGAVTTRIQFESEEPIAEDDGWFSGLTSWTYTI